MPDCPAAARPEARPSGADRGGFAARAGLWPEFRGRRLGRAARPLRFSASRAKVSAPGAADCCAEFICGLLGDEGHDRESGAAAGARPCSPRRRAENHDPHPRQCASRRKEGRADAQGDRSRSRDHRKDRRRNPAAGRDDAARPYALRHRAQAARRGAGLAGDHGRRGPADAAFGALALQSAMPARERFPRRDLRRFQPQIHARAGRSETPHREDAVCDLLRRDALLSQRHLHPCARRGRKADAARRRDRRPPTRAARNSRARRLRRHARRHFAQEGGLGSAAADR